MRIHIRTIIRLLLAGSCVAGSMGGCKCGRDVASPDEVSIDKPPIIEQNPEMPRPDISFPSEVKTKDASLNQFIQRTLEICYKGDYDGFRQLHGTAYTPTKKTDFEKVWERVRNIRVARIERHPRKDPAEYYVHAVVGLREPDSQNRTRRDLVIVCFQEAGEWRLGPAPKEAIRAMLAADSQPANADSQPSGNE